MVGFGAPQRFSQPHPQMNASTRAMMQKSGSTCILAGLDLAAKLLRMSAIGCASPSGSYWSWGLSSMHTAAMLRCSSFRMSRCMLLKLPYPVSPSRRIGTFVASDMNSKSSSTCVNWLHCCRAHQTGPKESRSPRFRQSLLPPYNFCAQTIVRFAMNSNCSDWSSVRN